MNNKLIGTEKILYFIMMKKEIQKLKYYLKMKMFG